MNGLLQKLSGGNLLSALFEGLYEKTDLVRARTTDALEQNRVLPKSWQKNSSVRK